MIDKSTKISELTVAEFLSLQNSASKQYEYGLKGIAKIFGCSRDRAQKIKNSGVIDDAIFQNGKIIVVDRDLALSLFDKKRNIPNSQSKEINPQNS